MKQKTVWNGIIFKTYRIHVISCAKNELLKTDQLEKSRNDLFMMPDMISLN